MTFRHVRIAILLFILFLVGGGSWLTKRRATEWTQTQWLVVYPIAGDQSEATRQYIRTLSDDTYHAIETFLETEAAHYHLPLQQPVEVHLAPQVDALPPAPPRDRQLLKVMWWSLEMRYWAWKHDTYHGLANMQMFVVYHDPRLTPELHESLGLEKGLVGVANVFADPRMSETNNVIIAHEFLHLVGATDKYDLATDRPIYPQGYAEPDKQPRYPQRFAALMAGRIPLSPTQAEIPPDLGFVIIGPATAREIGWLK